LDDASPPLTLNTPSLSRPVFFVRTSLRTDLLDILHAEAKEIIRKGGYAIKEQQMRALELLDVCAREGSDEARREVRSLMSPWVGGGGGGLGM